MVFSTQTHAFNSHIMTGLDVWDIQHDTKSTSEKRLLFLADSTPQWTYRNPSPWIRWDSTVDLSRSLTGTAKFRGDQSSDWRIDELNLNWQVSPSLGVKAGVVDYKTSWCRTYDVDSSWVRENDPFCVVRTTDQATGSAPGLQAHTNWVRGDHLLQAQLGFYNPLLLKHDDQEFNNQVLTLDSEVIKNKKVGVSFSGVNVHSSTEWRLSYLYTDQTADTRSTPQYPKFKKPQTVHLWYAGLGFAVGPHVRTQLTHLNSRLSSRFTDSFSPSFDYFRHYDRVSSTAELQWKLDGVNRIGLAYSVYTAQTKDAFQRKGSNPTRYPFVDGDFKNSSWSASWRRDWTPHLYTAVQWSDAAIEVDWKVLGATPYSSQAQGRAIGARLGLRY